MQVRKPHLNAIPPLDYAVDPIACRLTGMVVCGALPHNSDTRHQHHLPLKQETSEQAVETIILRLHVPCDDLHADSPRDARD